MNSMVNQAKSLATEEFNSMNEKNKSKNTVVEKAGNGMNMININAKARTSLFVKVNMDGIPIGRKVDLNAHGCYETLAQALEDMFLRSTTAPNATREFFSSFDLSLLNDDLAYSLFALGCKTSVNGINVVISLMVFHEV